MRQLSREERHVIERTPFDSLDHIRQALRDAESITSSEPIPLDDSADTSQRQKSLNSVIQELFSVFIFSKVCLNLASRAGNTGLHHDLLLVRQHIVSHNVEYRCLRPLLLCLINQAPDADIWTAVINLIPEVLVCIPPTSTIQSSEAPTTHSATSLQSLGRARSNIEACITNEIRHCTYRSVEGFHEKYFEGHTWNTQARRVWESAKGLYSDKRWAQLPSAPTGDALGHWWFGVQSQLLTNERAAYYRDITSESRIGRDTSDHLELVVKNRRRIGEVTADRKHDWKHVLAVGELKTAGYDPETPWLHIGSAVRNVFASQPTRLFVHAFALTGSTMETWVFDRSGPYSGVAFDVHEEPEKFIQVMCGYLMMSDEELGLDTFTERKDGKLFVTLPIEVCGTKQKREFELEPNPIAYHRAIVSRGTSCFFAKEKGALEYDSVIKFSWTSSKRPSEADLLIKANKRGVKGLPKVVGYHEEITSISKLRKDLKFPTRYKSRGIPSSNNDDSLSRSHLPPLRPPSQSASPRPRKRKWSDATSQPSKHPKVGGQSVQVDRVDAKGNKVDGCTEESQGTNLALRDESQMAYSDRIFRALVVSPAGRSIKQFQSTNELLQSLRDAITIHRSLYLDGKILHRDISENNIIITDLAKADGFRGMLIDLDLAEEDQGTSDPRHRAGTLHFMAIEVLLGLSHTYRHDLESFFYVLIWLCATRDRDKSLEETMLAQWHMGSYDEMARVKRGDMDVGGLEVIMGEFPPKFDLIKPLCRELRDILFPYRRGLFTGTPLDPKVLYDPIIKAFDETLAIMDIESMQVACD
ncbi:serine/threonine-protein kinase Sgk2 [Nemania sp. FL0031]|nr:serine/threonine-protein kinase Sgk2 [Nemania sp. FL0031]